MSDYPNKLQRQDIKLYFTLLCLLSRVFPDEKQLDLSQNRIESTGGLSCLPALHTFNISKNSLGDADAVSPLSECRSLTNLDVSGNRLAGPGVLDVSRTYSTLSPLPMIKHATSNENPVGKRFTKK